MEPKNGIKFRSEMQSVFSQSPIVIFAETAVEPFHLVFREKPAFVNISGVAVLVLLIAIAGLIPVLILTVIPVLVAVAAGSVVPAVLCAGILILRVPAVLIVGAVGILLIVAVYAGSLTAVFVFWSVVVVHVICPPLLMSLMGKIYTLNLKRTMSPSFMT